MLRKGLGLDNYLSKHFFGPGIFERPCQKFESVPKNNSSYITESFIIMYQPEYALSVISYSIDIVF